MTDDIDRKREERLARARAFLEAGRTQIAPRPSSPGAVPQPETTAPAGPGENGATAARPDPTRFGDWERNGRCIDF